MSTRSIASSAPAASALADAKSRKRLADAEAVVARQQEVIGKLRHLGRNTDAAEKLLDTFAEICRTIRRALRLRGGSSYSFAHPAAERLAGSSDLNDDNTESDDIAASILTLREEERALRGLISDLHDVEVRNEAIALASRCSVLRVNLARAQSPPAASRRGNAITARKPSGSKVMSTDPLSS